MTTILTTVFCLLLQAAPAPPSRGVTPAGDDYLVGPKDVIGVTVFGEDDYSRPSLTVAADGTVDYPHIGSLKVAGLTARQIEQELTRRLSPRYLRNPNISVVVKEFRSQRVWVTGQVRNPGQVELKGSATLMDALAADQAGPLLSDAGSYIVITHASGRQSGVGTSGSNPARPEDQIRVSRQEFELGRVSTIRLRDGDTIHVPPADRFFVSGEVKQTGAFVMSGELNVLKALAMAGGITERGAKNRITIKRVENGREVEVKVKENDIVRPGDTIVVPRRRF